MKEREDGKAHQEMTGFSDTTYYLCTMVKSLIPLMYNTQRTNSPYASKQVWNSFFRNG